jgi:hypothetical protein
MKTLDEQVLSAATGTLDPGVRCMGDCPPGVEVLHRLPTLEVVHARRIQRVGGEGSGTTGHQEPATPALTTTSEHPLTASR